MKVYARTQAITGKPLLPSLTELNKMGFDGMEICFEHPEVMEYLNKNMDSQLRSLISEAGFKNFSCSYHQDLADDRKFAQTKKAVKFSAGLGAKDFIIASVLGNRGDKELWRLGADRTQELLKITKDLEMRLLVEPEPVYVLCSTRDWMQLYNESNGEIYANIDLGHAFLTDQDPLGDIRKVGDKAAHCHIENMARGVHSHLLPWEGDMNLQKYIDTLRDIGFDGPLALDLYRDDYLEVASECLQYIKKLIDNSFNRVSN